MNIKNLSDRKQLIIKTVLYFQDDKHKPKYDVIGRETCMGDHKVCHFMNLQNMCNYM